jgi:hypothetical protein
LPTSKIALQIIVLMLRDKAQIPEFGQSNSLRDGGLMLTNSFGDDFCREVAPPLPERPQHVTQLGDLAGVSVCICYGSPG